MSEVFVARWHHLILYPDWLRHLHQRPRMIVEIIDALKPWDRYRKKNAD